jgi:hypothetical protein
MQKITTIGLLMAICVFWTFSAGRADAQTVIDQGECGANGNNLTWVLTSDSILTISGSGAMANYNPIYRPPWSAKSRQLKSALIGDSVTTIGLYAFGDCIDLLSVAIPNSVTTIESAAFQNCFGLTSVTIPNSVTTIKDGTFQDCIGLTSVAIPHSITSIEYNAFFNCYRLASIYVDAATPPQIVHSSVFSYVSRTIPIHVLCGKASDYQNAQYWSEFTNIIDDNTGIRILAQSNDMTMGTAAVTQVNTCTDDQAVIKAVANTKYRFVQWHDGITANPRTITVTQDTAFTAFFEQYIFHVSVTTNDNTMGTVSGENDYQKDSAAVLTATPNAGYRFVQWRDGITYNPRTVTVMQDTVFVAEFEADNGIAETDNNVFLQIYPNPVSGGQITISSEQGNGNVKAEIYTMQGVSVGSCSLTDKKATITISHLSNGVYFLKTGNSVKSFIVSK